MKETVQVRKDRPKHSTRPNFLIPINPSEIRKLPFPVEKYTLPKIITKDD